jgi:hypothetical protein
MKQTVTCRKLLLSFKSEIADFLKFVGRAVPRTPLADVRMSQFDDPYWESLINWRGRLLGMERMLVAAGLTQADLAPIKAETPLLEELSAFEPHGHF